MKIFKNKSQFKELKEKIKDYDIKRIVIITGAGISAESGINTFRDNNGLWENYSVYEVARPEAIELTPEIFFKFQNERAIDMKNKVPNKAHKELSKLEQKYHVSIITQNIDNLHEKAGSNNIIHIHGTNNEYKCTHCTNKGIYQDNIYGEECLECNKGLLRPNVVLFKEQVYDLYPSLDLIEKADLFIQIGTSGTVYPVAGFPEYTKALKINISLKEPDNEHYFDFNFKGKATKLVSELVKTLLVK